MSNCGLYIEGASSTRSAHIYRGGQQYAERRGGSALPSGPAGAEVAAAPGGGVHSYRGPVRRFCSLAAGEFSGALAGRPVSGALVSP